MLEAMDTLVTTVVAGVIVALVSAVAAYYFGMRQERQKRTYERQKEEEKRREEQEREEQQRREERQREITNRSVEALNGIIERASAALSVYRAWVKKMDSFHRNFSGDLSLEIEPLKEFARQGDEEVGAEVTSFGNYYIQQKPNLEPKSLRQ
jgi:hypothetical protein